MKRTLIVGATPNANRYAFMAADRLSRHGHEIIPLGIKKGEVFGQPILPIREFPDLPEIDTITLYIGPQHQAEYIDYLLQLQPRRLIFNPGTENPEFMTRAEQQGIEVVQGCTLVMLQSQTF